MKMQIIKYTGTLLLYLLTMVSLLAEDEGFPDSPPSGDETPIDHFELVLVLAAVIIGIYCLKKYRKRIKV